MRWHFVPLLLILGSRLCACVTGGTWPSTKEMWRRAPAVFLGTVVLADPDGDGQQMIFQPQLVRIRVDEAFKSVLAGQTIELRQGGNDCAAKFKTGTRFVFYMRGSTRRGWGLLWLDSAEPAGDDLLFLRALPGSARGTRLSGRVELYEDSVAGAFRSAGGVANVPVTIAGPHEFSREIVTNAAGVYELYDLPAGRYAVRIKAPAGLAMKFSTVTGSPYSPPTGSAVELVKNGGASVDFVLQADTRLTGRVLDQAGAPMANVCVHLEEPDGRGKNVGFECSKADGRFTLSMMSPGRYLLVAQDNVKLDNLKSTSTLYYPGVRDRELATVVPVEASRYLNHLDFRLPPGERRYKIEGQFQYADGVPAARATVTFTSPQSGYAETATSGADGTFGLLVVAGMRGELSGRLRVLEPILARCPKFQVEPDRRGMMRFLAASPIRLSADSDAAGIVLRLTSPSCKL